jgi:hypothetical protein
MSMKGNMDAQYASLSGKIHTLVIDKTLSISGAAADAKATGEAIIKATVGEGVIDTKVNEAVQTAFDDLVSLSVDEIRNICV